MQGRGGSISGPVGRRNWKYHGIKNILRRRLYSSDAETLGLRTLHPFTSQPLMRGVGEWGTGVVGDMLESAPSGNADGGPPPHLYKVL